MSQGLERYRNLFKSFIDGESSADEFQKAFLPLFKEEACRFEEPVFQLLDGLFGDADAYTDDPELLKSNPDYYLDELRLRAKVNEVYDRLTRLQSG